MIKKLLSVFILSIFFNTNSAAVFVVLNEVEISCSGANDGKLIAQVSGSGNGPYTYNWSGPGGFSSTTGPTGNITDSLVNLAPGSYTVVVTDNLLSTDSETEIVVDPLPISLSMIQNDSASCSVAADGTLEVFADFGAGGFSYVWDGNLLNNQAIFSGVNSGYHCVDVTDANGCIMSLCDTLYSDILSKIDTSISICQGDSFFIGNAWQLSAGIYTDTIFDSTGGNFFTNTLFYDDFEAAATSWTYSAGSGINGTYNNFWTISDDEGGVSPGLLVANCGVANNGDKTMYITNDFFPLSTGAFYIQGSALFQTDQNTTSVDISTVGHTNIVLNFDYIANGDVLFDNASVYYSDDGGVTWNLLVASLKSALCPNGSGQGLWTFGSYPLPVNAENIPNLKIRIKWINDANLTGTNPSVAINNLFVTGDVPIPPTGCDTLITTNLIVNSVYNMPVTDVVICQGLSFTLPGGLIVNSEGIYVDTLMTVFGCDSIITTNLSVDSFEIEIIDTTICQGEILMVNGVNYNSDIINTLDTAFYTASNCDSIIYDITLSVDSFEHVFIDTTICQGEMITVNGVSYNSDMLNTLDTAFYTLSGCDSILYDITLSVDSFETVMIDTTICQGETLTVNGVNYYSNITNTLDTVFYSASGCDSILYDITLNIDSFELVVIDTTICQGEILTVNGVNYNNNVSNVIDTARYTVSNCDSVYYDITVNVNNVDSVVIDRVICQGDSFEVNNIYYSTNVSNVLDTAFYTSTGCDSILYDISIVVNPLNTLIIDTSICQGETITYNGIVYTDSGNYMDTLQGQDSTFAKIDTGVSLSVSSVSSSAYGWANPAFYDNYTSNGAAVVDTSTNGFSFIELTDPFWRGNGTITNSIVNNMGVWGASVPASQWYGSSFTINIPTSQTYYILLAADNFFRFSLDGVVQITSDGTAISNNGQGAYGASQVSFVRLHIYPLFLTQGCHTITLEGNNSGGAGMFGGAILNNTAVEISNATNNSDLNYLFSTATATSFRSGSPNLTCPIGSFSLGSSVCDSCRILECDTLLTLSLQVDSFEMVVIDTTICQDEILTINGINYNSEITNILDTARYVISNCDSIYYDITVSVDSFEMVMIDTTICQGEMITVNGINYNSNVSNALDTARYVVSNCDSILYDITLSVDSFETIVIDTAICHGETLTVNGINYNSDILNTLDTAFYSANGCDSILYDITLRIDSFTIEVIDTTICQGEILIVNGVNYNSDRTNTLDTAFYSASGCDSIVYDITLNIDSVDVILVDTTICQGQSLTVNGTVYTDSGIYGDTTFYSVSGCDSFRYDIILNIDSFVIEVIDTTLCQGESITINGVNYNSEITNVLDTAYYSASGCDSVLYDITLNIDSFETIVIDTAICQDEVLTVNGINYNYDLTNTLDTAFYTSSGCDSIRYDITLRVDSVETIVIDTAVCQGESITVNGVNYSAEISNVFDTILYTINGCDSIIYDISLKIDSAIVEIIDTTICQGEMLTVNGVSYNSDLTNILDTAFYSVSGCDSIRYDITLSVDSFVSTAQNFTICEGDSVIVNGLTYDSTGIYNDTIVSLVTGCDSLLIEINLTVNDVYNDTIKPEICVNEVYILPNGAPENNSGTYSFSYTSIFGCDSFYHVELRVLPFPTGSANASICIGDSMFLAGAYQSTAGMYIDTLSNGPNCDSILTTTLIINTLPVISANASSTSLCGGDMLTLSGFGTINYSWSPVSVTDNVAFVPSLGTVTYIVTGTDANMCSDTASVSVTVNPTYSSTSNISICENALPYIFPDGSMHNSATDITQTSTLSTINNCDSLIVTNLSVNQNGDPGTIPDTIAVCESFNIVIDMVALNMQNYQWQLNDGSGFVNLFDSGIYTGTNTSTLIISPLSESLTGNIYRVLMTDECGNGGYMDETYIRVSEPHEVENPLDDVVRCLRDSSLIVVDYNGYDYVWNNGQTGPYLMVDGEGTYTLNFIENHTNCTMEDEFEVVIEDCIENCVVLAPTGFSPNSSSGANDVFRVMTSCEEGFSFYEFRIYNRWGEMVYLTTNPNVGWDGRYKNAYSEMGVYIYHIEYTKNGQTQKQSTKGQVTLIW